MLMSHYCKVFLKILQGTPRFFDFGIKQKLLFHNQVTDIDVDVPFLYVYQGWIPCLNMIYGMGWAVSKWNHQLD